jgi:hypothetical protein
MVPIKHTSRKSMGGFYTNYTVRGASQDAVAGALRGRRAIVSPARDGCVVAFDEASDDQDIDRITDLAVRLSRDLGGPVLAVLDHDDDLLWFTLAVNGETVDTYDSNPAYFDDSVPSEPRGGDAALLCRVFGAANVARVEAVLHAPDDGPYAFASERHAALVDALGLPPFAVGTAFATLERGEVPPGLTAAELIRPPAAGVGERMLASYPDMNPALVAQNLLESEGIPCRVSDLANLPQYVLGLAGGLSRPVGLWVLEDDADRASALLATLASDGPVDEEALTAAALAEAHPDAESAATELPGRQDPPQLFGRAAVVVIAVAVAVLLARACG